jgi:hypothetical protein
MISEESGSVRQLKLLGAARLNESAVSFSGLQ